MSACHKSEFYQDGSRPWSRRSADDPPTTYTIEGRSLTAATPGCSLSTLRGTFTTNDVIVAAFRQVLDNVLGLVHTSNNVEATFDIVEKIVQLVAFDDVAWTLLLVWTGLY